MRRTLLAMLGLTGCVGPRVLIDDTGVASSSATTSSDGAIESSSSTVGSAGESTSADASTSTTAIASSDEGDACPFVCPSDLPPSGSLECDPWVQDCPPGMKCMPWANDGGNSWNATACFPIADDPARVGEPCTVEGSGVSGIDDCDIRAMCWYVDSETNMGSCVDFCDGSEKDPVCVDPSTACVFGNEGVLILCLPYCNPLTQDCPESEACYPVNDSFACAHAAVRADGFYGGPCEFLNACDPGLFCDEALDSVPDCAGSIGCCNYFCDLAADDPDATCPDAAQGQSCVAWFDPGEAPPGFQTVGRCALP